eukprot:3568636-Amphidinium_carterae.1
MQLHHGLEESAAVKLIFLPKGARNLIHVWPSIKPSSGGGPGGWRLTPPLGPPRLSIGGKTLKIRRWAARGAQAVG